MAFKLLLPLFALSFRSAFAHCYDPTPPYPAPELHATHPVIESVFSSIEQDLLLHKPELPALDVAFSVEVTSADTTLWSFHQKASQGLNYVHKPDRDLREHTNVDRHSVYRIASISKIFTVLAALQAQEKGLLDFDKPITEYVSGLRNSGEAESARWRTSWESITLRSLASQLSGIQRESARMTPTWDLVTNIGATRDPVKVGYPPLGPKDMPSCGDPKTSFQCSRKEFLDDLKSQRPVYHPMFKSRYSNVAFVLLGMAVENVTGLSYQDLIQTWIFDPLNMTDSSIEKPDDSKGQILGAGSNWGLNLGIYNGTGGIYSSTDSLSRLLRHILSTPLLRDTWLHPHSYSAGGGSYYGMPWEIFHSSRFLPNHGHRPTTFYTKAGGLTGYYSNIILMPEQGVGITILVAGPLERATTLSWVRETVTKQLVPALEDVALEQMRTRYAGTYAAAAATGLDSRITLAVSKTRGLHVTRWTSNGTDFLTHFGLLSQQFEPVPRWHAQVIPSLLVDEHNGQRREVWRVKFAPEKEAAASTNLWDEFCYDDVQGMQYGGLDVNEIVFEVGKSGQAAALTIEGLRVRLERVNETVPDGFEWEVATEKWWWRLARTTQRAFSIGAVQ